jgi:23S rRNA A2030 N6-methylase RlmJ
LEDLQRRGDALPHGVNYRHGFHAGNFADAVKHATLARIVSYLGEKPAPFRVIDTHAGAGLYDLTGPEAARTGEWREGIGRSRAPRRRRCCRLISMR